MEPAKWTASAEIDHVLPVWMKSPIPAGKKYVEYGCGPEKWVYFTVSAKDDSPMLVDVAIKNCATAEMVHYYLEPIDNKISVGHSMCGGAFYFDDGRPYEATFRLVDGSGNKSANFFGSMLFVAPVSPFDSPSG